MALRLVIFLLLVLLFSCEKENQPPSCVIIDPSHKSSFNLGDTITIKVFASDPENNIEEFNLYIDESTVKTFNYQAFNIDGTQVTFENTPYYFSMISEAYQPGLHTIKTTVKDEGGLEAVDEIEITLNASLPGVTMGTVDSVTAGTAVVSGEVTTAGGSSVTARGFCWGTLENPSLSGNHSSEGSGMGEFSGKITGLLCETVYYVRAYASNDLGTIYSDQESFTTGSCYSIPTVTTAEVTSVTESSAICGGEVSSSGGAHVNERGVCWSTSQNPILSDNSRGIGSGIGSYSDTISNLICATTYYLRAYATNSQGTSYGKQVSFTTGSCPGLPTLLTLNIGNISDDAAECGGTILDDGGSPITARGVCWSTSEDPTIADSHTSDGVGTGSYTSYITGLTCATSYFIRAYATNSSGTSYGNQASFTTASCPGWPSLTTRHIDNISDVAAECGGNILDDGGSPIIAKGVCWSTLEDPTIADSHTSDGAGAGSYTSSITGLTCGASYFVRAYATNSNGTSYGNQASFSTSQCQNAPHLSKAVLNNITETSAKGRAQVEYEGGSPVINRGICWSTQPNPTISDNHTDNGSGTGEFSSSISGLVPNTDYYYRAFATNSEWTGYGEQVKMKSWKGTVTDYDGNLYYTVEIGNQVWMAQNMNVIHYPDGTSIPLVVDNSIWDVLPWDSKAYCWYDNDPDNGEIYGALYTWTAATNGFSSETTPDGVQGICPDGWHVPSDAEWIELELSIGMDPDEAYETGFRASADGGKLKEAGTEHWFDNHPSTTNETGFTALPGGTRSYDGLFKYFEWNAWWWNSSESGGRARKILDSTNSIARYNSDKPVGMSVRCIQDE